MELPQLPSSISRFGKLLGVLLLALPAYLRANAAAPIEILFLGDSLTAGYGLKPEDAYPALIGETLQADGTPVEIRNAGLSGDTTAGGARRIAWVLRQAPDIVVIALGGNDALRGLDPATMRDNLEATITTIREDAPTARILLAGMLAPPNLGPAYGAAFREVFADLGARPEITFVPFLLEGVAGDPALNQTDGIHPNREGQKKVAAHLLETLGPLVQEIAEAKED